MADQHQSTNSTNSGNQSSSVNGNMMPDSKTVNEFHVNDDVDRDANAHHHTLGFGPNNAASGSHNHDGTNSVALLDGFIINGAKGGNTAVASLIAAMVQLGATDQTTA